MKEIIFQTMLWGGGIENNGFQLFYWSLLDNVETLYCNNSLFTFPFPSILEISRNFAIQQRKQIRKWEKISISAYGLGQFTFLPYKHSLLISLLIRNSLQIFTLLGSKGHILTSKGIRTYFDSRIERSWWHFKENYEAS